jgi:plasmid stabilization system protein ParE
VTIVWSSRALQHLVALREFIATDKPQAARDVSATILAAVDLLARQPGLGRPGRIRGTRELIVPGTPYLIPYRVRENRLEIVAIFHGRRRWPSKL